MIELLTDSRFLALRDLARSWGYVLLCNVPYSSIDLDDDDLRLAPFARSMGMYPEYSTVFASELETDIVYVLCGLIHELGHLCVGACYMDPNEGQEYNFFGWEIVVAGAIGLSRDDFKRGNFAYAAEDDEVGRMSARSREKLFKERVEFARTTGIVDGRVPLARPGRWKGDG